MTKMSILSKVIKVFKTMNGFSGNRVGDELLAVNDEVVTNDRHVTVLQLFADMPATSELPITLVNHTEYERVSVMLNSEINILEFV